MQADKHSSYKEKRIYVSKLYIGVLTKKLKIRDALAKFPKDIEDETITAAWHALCHLESDEDLREHDKMYAEEQDEYIESIAFTLSKGDALPENIINAYKPYHNGALNPSSNTIKGIIHNFKKFLCID